MGIVAKQINRGNDLLIQITGPHQSVTLNSVPNITILEIQLQRVDRRFDDLVQICITGTDIAFPGKHREMIHRKDIADIHRFFRKQFDLRKTETTLAKGKIRHKRNCYFQFSGSVVVACILIAIRCASFTERFTEGDSKLCKSLYLSGQKTNATANLLAKVQNDIGTLALKNGAMVHTERYASLFFN